MPSENSRNDSVLYAPTSEVGVKSEHLRDTYFKIECSWYQTAVEGKTYPKGHALVSLSLEVQVLEKAQSGNDISEGLKDLLAFLKGSSPKERTTSWIKHVFLVVPTQPGYIIRTKCFNDRFRGCVGLGDYLDRTVFQERKTPADLDNITSLLDSSVLMFVQSESLLSSAELVEELHARINFEWLLHKTPERRTIALIHGRDHIEAFKPLYLSANALGIDLVILDCPGHWLLDAEYRHMYKTFLPIDMAVDKGFSLRIAMALKAYGSVDGICTVSDRCIVPVAKAARILGLPTEHPFSLSRSINKHETRLLDDASSTAVLVADMSDLKSQLDHSRFCPQYPLIVKPNVGWGSEYVFKVKNEAELLESVERVSQGTPRKVLIEDYIDGPELDVNFILLDGDILFFEVSDDFPSPGDYGSLDCDFWENTNTLPSKVSSEEYDIVRNKLHGLLLRLGFKTGVFHLEARIKNSSMEYSEEDGVMDLRPSSDRTSQGTARCHLIEINPRPPGFPCVAATAVSYGVNMFDAHFLSCLQDYERLRILTTPFEPKSELPNFARAWSQIVFFKVEKGGICASSNVCEQALQQLPARGAHVTDSVCFFHAGQRIPEPKPGIVMFGAFFILVSRECRPEVVQASLELQRRFSIPIEEA